MAESVEINGRKGKVDVSSTEERLSEEKGSEEEGG